MLYGDLVSILEDGPRIRRKALEPVGIYDESVCWGVWLKDIDQVDEKIARDRPSHAHLVISAIHPYEWQFIFRVQLELQHKQGSFATAATLLADHGVNIIYAQCVPTSYRHATCNLVCEAIKVKENFPFKDQDIGKPKALHERSLQIARKMLDFMSRLEISLAEQNLNKAFLHDGLFNESYLCSFREDQLGVNTWKKHEDKTVNAFKLDAASNLFFLFRCCDVFGEQRPIEFEYNAKHQRLVSHPRSDFRGIAEEKGIDLPARGIASFNPYELYLRIEPLKKDKKDSIILFSVDYDAHYPRGTNDVSSKGLLAGISNRIAESNLDINLIKISNHTSGYRARSETGRVTFIGSGRRPEKHQLKHLGDEIRGLKSQLQYFSRVEPRLTPLQGVRVFISMPQEIDRPEEMKKAIIKTATQAGIEEEDLVWTRTITENVTARVAADMRSCQALLQIVSKDKLQWLIAEYGMAVALNLVRVRLVDKEDSVEMWKQRLKLEPGRELLQISFKDDTSKMELVLAEAFAEIGKQLLEKGSSY